MSAWGHPLLLAVAGVAWAVFFAWFARGQRRAVAWVEARSGERFRERLTRWKTGRLAWPLGVLFLAGALLVLAAGGPRGEGEATETAAVPRLVFLLDASISMGAVDAVRDPRIAAPGGEGATQYRFHRARSLAAALVEATPGSEAALVTFSGVATYQLPMSGDRDLFAETLAWAELHNVYRQSGSDFTAALDAALHLAGETPGVQVVLLSDGEIPEGAEAGFGEPLAALAAAGVPVHSVAVGSDEGRELVVWDPQILAESGERVPLVELTTRREARHLERMAAESGGYFVPDRLGVERDLAAEVMKRAVRGEVGRREVSEAGAGGGAASLLVALFALVFVLETLWWDRPRRRGPAFELDRLGKPSAGRRLPPAGLVLCLGLGLAMAAVSGCGGGGGEAGDGAAGDSRASLLERAHRANEAGIRSDRVGSHEEARRQYRRSIGYGVQPEVPTHNLARSRTLAGSLSEAHDLYQEAMELAPDADAPAHASAAYNDGVALWRWGAEERDPAGCQLQRTRDLWQASRSRFAGVAAGEAALAAHAAANRAHVDAALAEVEALIADPPEACRAGESSSDGGGAGGDGDGEEQDTPPGGNGEDPGDGGSAAEGESGEDGEAGGGGGGGGSHEEDSGDGEGGEGGSNEGDSGDGDADEGDADEGDSGEGDSGKAGAGGGAEGNEGEEAGGGGADGDDEASSGGVGAAQAPDQATLDAERARIEEQRRAEGRFFRRTGPEQFPRESWLNPDPVIRW